MSMSSRTERFNEYCLAEKNYDEAKLAFPAVIFLGWAGIGRLLEGQMFMFFVYFLTFGLLGIGWVVDIGIYAGKLAKYKQEYKQAKEAWQK